MNSVEKLTAAITMVEEARGVPLSASCVVHRAEMLEVLDDARESLPTDFESARKIIETRDAIIEEARVSAEQMIAIAREDVLSALYDGEFLSSDAFIAVERTARGAQFIWPDAYTPARERNYGQATIYYANYQP